MHWSGLSQTAANINWTAFAKITGVTKVDGVIVGQPVRFTALSNAIKAVPIDDWKLLLLVFI